LKPEHIKLFITHFSIIAIKLQRITQIDNFNQNLDKTNELLSICPGNYNVPSQSGRPLSGSEKPTTNIVKRQKMGYFDFSAYQKVK